MTKKPSSEESKARDKKLSKGLHDSMQFDEILDQNEKQYRDILSGIEDGYYEVDIAGNLSFFNDSLCKIYGYARDELIGMNNREYMSPATAKKAYLVFNGVYKTGEPAKIFDWEFLKKDGTKIDVEISVSLIKNLKGDAVGFRGIVRDIGERKLIEAALNRTHEELEGRVAERTGDLIKINKRLEQEITERKQAEKTLKEQTKTLNDILGKAADGICVCHNIPDFPNVKFTHWNPKMTEITGYTIEEINRLGWYQSMYPDPEVQQKAIERMSKMRQGDDILTEEWVIATKDGNQKILSISTSVLKENNGEIHVLALMQDVSERKLYEERLIFSRKEWEDIFHAIGHPTIILGPDHSILAANNATQKITGMTEALLKNKKCYDIFHNTHKPPELCPMEALLHKGSLETVEMEMEAFNGTFLVSCTPMTDNDGHLKKIIHIATDITEKKKFEEQIRQATKMESIGILAGGIAHDFNNLLYIITGNAELALEDIPEWNPVHASLQEIMTAGLRAAGIVEQLVNFSRKTDQELKPIYAITVIKDALNFLRATIPATIEIRKHLPETEVTILADSVQINQVLMNICTNASQSMEETGGIIEVTVENESLTKDSKYNCPNLIAGDYVKITISDTGPGIDPEIINQIFDPYFTTKEFGKGSGMGLAVVHGIVKNHNGMITVDSQPGKGATFTILFPVVAEKPVMAVKAPDELLHGNETILFVDDEESIVYMTQQILAHLGYTVESKLNPVEALALFQSKPDQFDLVITDMTMPQMTGVKLAEKIKEVRPDIPVIICTGHSPLIDEEKANKLGIAAFVMKPIKMRDISQTIRKVLDNKESSGQG